jgi:hypothetical protein
MLTTKRETARVSGACIVVIAVNCGRRAGSSHIVTLGQMTRIGCGTVDRGMNAPI